MKNFKVFWGAIALFATISAIGTIADYKINHDPKNSEPVKIITEDVNLDNIFTPVENIEIDINNQEQTENSSKTR